MNTTKEFLTALDKLNIVDFNDDKLISKDGFSIGIYTELNDSGIKQLLPVQVVFRIARGKTYIQSWGSGSNEDNEDMVTWFMTTKARVNKMKREEERQTEIRDNMLFDMLTGMK